MNYGATTLGPLSTDPEADIKTVEEFWKKKGFTTKVEHSTNPKETQIRLTAPVGYDNAGQSQACPCRRCRRPMPSGACHFEVRWVRASAAARSRRITAGT